jgi:hypothetical protein
VLRVRPLTLALCCVVLIAAFAGCRDGHDTEAIYATRADAEKSGEFQRDWLPDFLPMSSHAIQLAYDLSPSQEWCAFEFDAADGDTFLNSVTPVDRLAPPVTQVPSPYVNWWPKSLQGTLDFDEIRRAGLTLYSETHRVSQVENERLLFAIDRIHGRGYFYGR